MDLSSFSQQDVVDLTSDSDLGRYFTFVYKMYKTCRTTARKVVVDIFVYDPSRAGIGVNPSMFPKSVIINQAFK